MISRMSMARRAVKWIQAGACKGKPKEGKAAGEGGEQTAVRIGEAKEHPSHQLEHKRGIYFCKGCGGYAVQRLQTMFRTLK